MMLRMVARERVAVPGKGGWQITLAVVDNMLRSSFYMAATEIINRQDVSNYG